ncbi:MAG: hypothetical protein QXG16_05030 [Candidatus Anstonellaceae archaeon]
MKEKIKIICLILITISIIVFSFTYFIKSLINYACASPKISMIKLSTETNATQKVGEFIVGRTFLGISCLLWEKIITITIPSTI